MALIQKTVGVGGDYADMGTAWASIAGPWGPAPVIGDDYEFEIISSFTENTGVLLPLAVTFNGHFVRFVDNGNYLITLAFGKAFQFFDDGAGASINDSVQLIGLTIYAAQKPGMGLIRILLARTLWAGTSMSLVLDSVVLLSVDNTNVAGSIFGFCISIGSVKITMKNCISYNFAYGIEIFVDVNAATSGNYIENCTVYNSGAYGIDFTYAVSQVNKFATFNNVVVSKSTGTDWGTGGAGPGNFFIFNNCADSDNTLAALPGTKTDCITGIVDTDYISIVSGNDDFLRIDTQSQLYAEGRQPTIADNIVDIDGYNRPDIFNHYAIGVSEANITADFVGTPLNVNIGENVRFVITITATVNYNVVLTYGDGESTNDEDTRHDYETPGFKTVVMVVTDFLGVTYTLTRTDYVEVNGYGLTFKGKPTSGEAALRVKFTPEFEPI